MADLQTRVIRSRFIIFIAGLQIVPFGIPYQLTCPQQSHWKIFSKNRCQHAENYTCLLNILNMEYEQNCKGPEKINIGFKYILQPNFNKGKCDAERYQPFNFETEGYTNCSSLKSRCYSEGQEIFSNGSAKSDRSCYCDSASGYVFVSSTRDKYCTPSAEDCSCYKNITEGVISTYDIGMYSIENITYHPREQSGVIQIVNTIRDYDDITYNMTRNGHARLEAAILVLVMLILMLLIPYPSAICITKACQTQPMTTCMQCKCCENTTYNNTIEDNRPIDIESGTSYEMVTHQTVLTGFDKCVLQRYMSNLSNTEIIEFASILRNKALISKRAYSYIESCYNKNNYNNMRSAAIRDFTEMHTDIRNIVFVMYSLDNKYKSLAVQLFTTFKNLLELKPVFVSRIDTKDRTYIQTYFTVMKKKVQEMEFENPVEYLRNLAKKIQEKGTRYDQANEKIFTEICDKFVVLLALTIDALANKTNDIDPRGNLFNEIEAIISKSSCPDLSRCMLYGRKAVALSFQNNREEGEDMEKMALICAANVVPCLETVDMYYKIVLFHRAWYENNPQKELIFIEKVKQKAFDILEGIGDELGQSWSRRFVVRLLFCYLGVGMRCRFISDYHIHPEYVKMSDELLQKYDSKAAEIRVQMFFHIAKARLSHLKGDLANAILYNEEAKNIATRGAYSELETILDNEKILKKSWSLAPELLPSLPNIGQQ